MKKQLEELNKTPGIMGSYVFSLKKQVLANKMPPVFSDTKLLTIGKLLVKVYLAGKMSLQSVSEISLFYEESIIIIREIVDKTYVIVLFDPSMRINLLTVSLNMIMDDLKKLADEQQPVPVKKEKHSPVKNIPSLRTEKNEVQRPFEITEKEDYEPAVIDPDTLISSGPMAGVLQEMQTALTKVVGPIAKIIFIDALQEWISTDKPDFSTIQGLVEIVKKEINDSEKFDMYYEKITPYIWVDN